MHNNLVTLPEIGNLARLKYLNMEFPDTMPEIPLTFWNLTTLHLLAFKGKERFYAEKSEENSLLREYIKEGKFIRFI